MGLDEITGRLSTSTTRRTVVKTGAKLAYAAPLVAASFKLAELKTIAQTASGVQDPVCIGTRDGCNSGGCGPGGSCICTVTPEGGVFCFSQFCGPACTSSAQCVDGNGVQNGLCSTNTGGCCNGQGDCILFSNFCTPEVAPAGAAGVIRE